MGIAPGSIGDWLLVLTILICIHLPSFIAVVTERSNLRASRANYLISFLVGVVGPFAIAALLNQIDGLADNKRLFIAWIIVWLVLQIWFYRVLVRRTRDVGHTKALAYAAAFPLGIFICIYLLFPSSKPSHPQVAI